MSQVTAEQFGQRLIDCNLLEPRQVDRVFGELGSRHVDIEKVHQTLLRNELLTNWQVDRIMEGHIQGYFYGDYKVLYLVGAGTFARVYRAVHRVTGDVRAVKVLRQRYTADVDTRDRFLQEAKMVMTLRHPNIVPIYEVDEERGRSFMVMDFVEGQNLRDFVRIHKKLDPKTALRITRDVASGLNHAYGKGITHRDLKLSNVLLSARGRALLVDFGLAAVAEAGGRSGGQGGGSNPRSIDYAGLERATGVTRDDKRSDIFFLGCMLYHMVSGHPPLVETKERIQRLSVQRYRDIKPITLHEPGLSHRLVVAINQSLDLDPEKRYQTPAEVKDMLDQTIEALKRGDDSSYDENLAKQEAEEFLKKESKVHEGRSFTLMVIDSNLKMQDLLRDQFKDLGYRVLIFSDPSRGLIRFTGGLADSAEKKPADCVIFGCASLGFDGVDAFNEFGKHEMTRDVPAILITNQKQGALVKEAMLAPHRVHLSMPLKLKSLRATLRELLKIPS